MAGNGMDPTTPTTPLPGALPLPLDGAEQRREDRKRRQGRGPQEPEPEPWWENPQMAMPLFPIGDPDCPLVLDARRPPAFCRLYKTAPDGRRVVARDETTGAVKALAPDVEREDIEAYGGGRYALELYPQLAADSPSGVVRPLATRRIEVSGEEIPWPEEPYRGGGGRRGYDDGYSDAPRPRGGLEGIAETINRNPAFADLLGLVLPAMVKRVAGPEEAPELVVARLQAEREARMAEREADREARRQEERERHEQELARAEQRRLDRETEAKAEAARLEQLRLAREEERRAEDRAWEKRQEAKAAERAEEERAFQRRLEAAREDRAQEAREFERRQAAAREALAAEERAWSKRLLEAQSGGTTGIVGQVEKLGKVAEALGYSRDTGEGMGAAAAAVGSAVQSVGGMVQQHLAESAATERAKLEVERERMRLEFQANTPHDAEPVRATVTHTPLAQAAPVGLPPSSGEPAPAELPQPAPPEATEEAPPLEATEAEEKQSDEPPSQPVQP